MSGCVLRAIEARDRGLPVCCTCDVADDADDDYYESFEIMGGES